MLTSQLPVTIRPYSIFAGKSEGSGDRGASVVPTVLSAIMTRRDPPPERAEHERPCVVPRGRTRLELIAVFALLWLPFARLRESG